MENRLILVRHPIILDKLSRLRDKNCHSSEFRNLMSEISRYLAFEATQELETDSVEIETPLSKDSFQRVRNFPMVISILRAGNGMLDGVLSVLTGAQAGHIGIYRDKF
ncbi:MAG: uracil phosphoribosyltransferase, partial [Bdellovibrionales bacterium]|nr:uracil phosphoribosyltransferase [Bdellovibrionales bacterium]